MILHEMPATHGDLADPTTWEIELTKEEVDSIQSGGSPRLVLSFPGGSNILNPRTTFIYVRQEKSESRAQKEWLERRKSIGY